MLSSLRFRIRIRALILPVVVLFGGRAASAQPWAVHEEPPRRQPQEIAAQVETADRQAPLNLPAVRDTGRRTTVSDPAAWPPDQFDPAVRPPGVDEHKEAGTNRPDASRRVVTLTNEERTERSRTPLAHVTQLALIACRHNKDMLAHDYAGHEDSDGRQVHDRLFREHRTLLVGQYGENVQQAWGSQVRQADLAALAVNGWMDSPPHRKNILRPQFTHLGACVTRKDNAMRATQVFANIAGELTEPLPWSISAGDSLATAARSSRPDITFERYGFRRAGADGDLDFEDTVPFDGTIRVPSEPGRYELRMLYVKTGEGDAQTYHFSFGPRVRVTAP